MAWSCTQPTMLESLGLPSLPQRCTNRWCLLLWDFCSCLLHSNSWLIHCPQVKTFINFLSLCIEQWLSTPSAQENCPDSLLKIANAHPHLRLLLLESLVVALGHQTFQELLEKGWEINCWDVACWKCTSTLTLAKNSSLKILQSYH